jgi:hypothetical protein
VRPFDRIIGADVNVRTTEGSSLVGCWDGVTTRQEEDQGWRGHDHSLFFLRGGVEGFRLECGIVTWGRRGGGDEVLTNKLIKRKSSL